MKFRVVVGVALGLMGGRGGRSSSTRGTAAATSHRTGHAARDGQHRCRRVLCISRAYYLHAKHSPLS
jgi:hypothetical protein